MKPSRWELIVDSPPDTHHVYVFTLQTPANTLAYTMQGMMSTSQQLVAYIELQNEKLLQQSTEELLVKQYMIFYSLQWYIFQFVKNFDTFICLVLCVLQSTSFFFIASSLRLQPHVI